MPPVKAKPTANCHRMYTELRIQEIGKAGSFTGHAAVFNKLVPGYNEIVLPGAFTKTINDQDSKWPVFYEHWDWVGMNFEAEQDAKGLLVSSRLEIEWTPLAQSAYGLMRLAHEAGRPAGLSIGFDPIEVSDGSDWDKSIPDPDLPTLNGIDMLHVIRMYEHSILAPGFQAVQDADVDSVRSSARLRNFVLRCMNDIGYKSELAPAPPDGTLAAEHEAAALRTALYEELRNVNKQLGGK